MVHDARPPRHQPELSRLDLEMPNMDAGRVKLPGEPNLDCEAEPPSPGTAAAARRRAKVKGNNERSGRSPSREPKPEQRVNEQQAPQAPLYSKQVGVKDKDSKDEETRLDVIEPFEDILGGASKKLVNSVFASVHELLTEAGKAIVDDKRKQVESLVEENNVMRERLNSVLSATWRFTEEGWQGGGGPCAATQQPGALTLAPAAKFNNNGGSALWEVPADFDAHEAKCNAVQSVVHEFVPRPHWNGHTVEDQAGAGMTRTNTLVQTLKTRYTSTMIDGAAVKRKGIGAFIISQDSRKRNAWDVFSAIMIGYDFVTVPWSLFDFPETLFTAIMNMLTIVFWTTDMVVSCFTGYVMKNGKDMLEPRPVFMHYIRYQLPFDLIINGLDWVFFVIEIAAGSGSRAGDTGRILKMRRIVRIARLYRLVKLIKVRRMIFILIEKIESDLVFVLPLFVRILLLMTLGGHVLGTCWYAIGLLGKETNTGRNWIDEYELESRDWFYRYTVAFSFAINKLVLSDSLVQPQNSGECLFVPFVLVLGVMNFFHIAAIALRSFETLFSVRSDAFKEFFLLRVYLKQHSVLPSLAFRVSTYAENVCKPQLELIPSSKLQVLPLLSQQLRCELNVSVEFNGLFAHPLVELCRDNSEIMQGFGNPANNVLKNHMLASGEIAFSRNTRSKHMRIVTTGELHYIKGKSWQDDAVDVKAVHGDWLSEAAIWTVWTHQGDCCASKHSQCVMVDIHTFWEVVEKDPEMFSVMSAYAQLFVDDLNYNYPSSLVDTSIGEQAVAKVESWISQIRRQSGGKSLARRPSVGEAMLTKMSSKSGREVAPPTSEPVMLGSKEPKKPKIKKAKT
jgi:hypothetical protein